MIQGPGSVDPSSPSPPHGIPPGDGSPPRHIRSFLFPEQL